MRRRVLLMALALAAPAAAQEPPPTSFWQTLGDTTLERLVVQALDANRDLRMVEARVGQARAVRSESRLDLAPVVTASAGYSRQRLASAAYPGGAGRFPDQNVWDAGVRLSWEVDVFGRLRNSLRGQTALLSSAEEDVRDVQVLLAAEVARVYYDLHGATERLAVAERNAENQRRSLQLTEDRLELGRGNALDTERAQAQLSSTLASIPALEAEIAADRHRLGVLLGGADPLLPDVSGEDDCAPPLPAALELTDTDALVRGRPDVLSAERRMDATGAFVGSAKADYLPRLSIGAVAGYTADAFDALGSSGTPRYAIGPVISWPFLDLGRVKTRVDAARASHLEARAQYEQSVLRASEEVQTALSSYAGARARLRHLEDAASASERATALARLRFEEGATDFLEVLDTERRQLEAQDQLAVGRAQASSALIEVYRALGGRSPLMTR